MTAFARNPSALARTRGARRWLAATLAASSLSAGAFGQGLDWLADPATGRWYSQSGTRMPWTVADEYARSFGGNLASVRSAPESAFLDASFFSLAPLGEFHWIGLFQDPLDPGFSEPSSGWKWSSGEPLTFSNWAAGQPDNALPLPEDYARVLGSAWAPNSARWADSSDATGEGIGDPVEDWYIGGGQIVVFNTVSSNVLVGSLQLQFDPNFPNNPASPPTALFAPTASRVFVGGVVNVRHFYVEQGAVLKIEGPNPFKLLASGDVWIRGRVIANGNSSNGVSTLNTTNIPEVGASGQAGGGRGGTGSPLTTASSPQGGAGFGAFGAAGGGGQGGESGWSNTSAIDRRRGGGGGGGRLGDDILYFGPVYPGSSAHLEQRRIGFDAESGFDNLLADNGALSGPGPAHGGIAGSTPFLDGDDGNDFFGLVRDDASGAYLLGELARPWAGAGGGGGGDAAQVPSGQAWPAQPFNPSGDEKGAGGGGGGGSVHVIAVGSVLFGQQGQLSARGGFGGGGENTIFLNRVGGGSGGGSGGHVVLECGALLDLRAKSAVIVNNIFDQNWAIDVRGGQGGAGSSDLGGAYVSVNGQTETSPGQDACPPGYPFTGVNSCRGHVDGAGGDGGPGIVQLHTRTGRVGTSSANADILLASGATLATVCAPEPLFAQGSNGPNPAHFISGAGGALALFQMDSSDCDGDGTPDKYEIALDGSLDLNGNGVLDSCESPTYCTSSTSTNGCVASIAGIGTPSASATSGFELIANDVEGARSGRFYYGFAPAALPWAPASTSFQCVAFPFQRLPLASSGGTSGSCDGRYALDWNAWRATNPGALGSPFAAGDVLHAQAWFRDPGAPRGTNLSDAVMFTLQP